MSLLKPRIMTPARLAANRCNALKSTGPRTARGKAQSCLNRLKTGGRYKKQKHLTPSPIAGPILIGPSDSRCRRRKGVVTQRKKSTYTFDHGKTQIKRC
jgi:hypothetical protein